MGYEYERAGTASPFMFCEPLAGWRQASVRPRRTKVERAQEVEGLLRTRYPSAEQVTLVCDNLDTHTRGAFYETFEPEKARAVVRRLAFCRTPKHGSWLKVAENELSAMTRQCVTGRRFATIEELREQATAWHEHGNAQQRGVDWHFKVDDARLKLKSIYPKPKSDRDPEFFLELRVEFENRPEPIDDGDGVLVDGGDEALAGGGLLGDTLVAVASRGLLAHPVPEPLDRVEVRAVRLAPVVVGVEF